MRINHLLPPSVVFPNSENNLATLEVILKSLPLDDTLILCTRINLKLSLPNEQQQQFQLIDFLFSSEQIAQIAGYVRTKPGSIVFHRGQILELMRWVCLYCDQTPNFTNDFDTPESRQAFAQAVLIASELWEKRVYSPLYTAKGEFVFDQNKMPGVSRESLIENAPQMDPIKAFGRAKQLFGKHYQNFEQIFMKRTELSYLEYATFVFYIVSTYIGQDEIIPFIPANSMSDAPHLQNAWLKFIKLVSQTPEALKKALWPNGDNVAGKFSLRPLRDKPLLITTEGRAIVLDATLWIEMILIGPLFRILPEIHAPDSKKEGNMAFENFGYAFESYAQSILLRMYPKSKYLPDRLICNPKAGTEEIADACLLDVNNQYILFEMKAKWLTENKAQTGSPDDYYHYLTETYTSNRGIFQLARAIGNLASGKWESESIQIVSGSRIFPVLVVHDTFLDAPFHQALVASEFKKQLEPDETPVMSDLIKGSFHVTLPIIITIDVLEILEELVRKISLSELLADYSASVPDRATSLRDFLLRTKYANLIKSLDVSDASLLSVANEAIIELEKLVEHSASIE